MAKSFTVHGIEAIKPGDIRREIPDGKVKGLYFIIQPSGVASWALRYRFAGKSKKLTIGPYPALTLGMARELAVNAVSVVAAGRDPAEEKKVARVLAGEAVKDEVGAVVSQFIERYAKANMRESSRNEIERLLNHDVVAAWKGRSIKTITRIDVVKLLDAVNDRGATITANRVLAATRRLFNWCIDRGIIEASPLSGMKAPTIEKSRDRVLSDDELRRVLKAADGLGWPFGPIVNLLVLTGQRLSEVSDMEWSELDLDRARWVIPAIRAKNGVEHLVDLSPKVVEILKALPRIANGPKPSRYVFTTTGSSPVSGWSRAKRNIDKAVHGALKREAKERGEDPDHVEPIPEWRFHDLRRTAASGMAGLGIQIHVVEKILNHVSGTFGGIVGVYQRHDFADEKKKALLAWSRRVEVIVSGVAAANVIEFSSLQAAQ